MVSRDEDIRLPSGHITFVMTDIEGSTRLFRQLGDGYKEVLATHNELLRAAFSAHGGVELGTEGDSLFVAFEDSTEAVNACLEAQLSLERAQWPSGATVKVRIGVHVGDVEPVGHDYVSLAIHQVARISSGAHGGQVLVSEDVADEVRGHLPDDVDLTRLGSFQLRGFATPETLFQVRHPDLPAEFPPLRAVGVVAHNLPYVRTSFVGRTAERAALAQLLETTGVVTIVGPGGVGKTRLAVQVAFDVMDAYEHGAWLVDLVPSTGAVSLARAVAGVMGVPEEAGQDATASLVRALELREALLILDNCEHIIDEAAELAERLTQSCPKLTVLATSREPLDIDGEAVWRVEPLSVTSDAGGLSDAVRLLVERAQLARPGFELTDDNRGQAEDIVRHLSGLPLAIELAAAALGERTLDGVVAGLSDRFSILTRGRRTAPDRHQTLQAALQWSLDLLQPRERRLYQRLAVFAGSGTGDAASEICADDLVPTPDIPGMIGHLTRASLLATDPEHADRWVMLESLRQLAQRELAASGDAEMVEAAHRRWFLDLAEDLGRAIGQSDQAPAMKALELDRLNIRSAIDGAIAVGDAETSLRLGVAMAPFWTSHGDWAEGSERLTQALDIDVDDPALCGPAEAALGRLRLLSGDLSGASDAFDRGIDHATNSGDDVTRARALSGAGYVAFRRSNLDEAESHWTEALRLAEPLGEDRITAEILRSSAIATASKGDQEKAGELLSRAMEAARRAGDNQLLRLILGSWAEMNLWLGRYTVAADAYGDALDIATEIGDISARPLLLAELGWMALLAGDPTKAETLAVEAIEFAEDLHSPRVLAHALRLGGEAVLRSGDHERSGELLDRALGVAKGLDAPAEVAGVLCSQAHRSLHLLEDEAANATATEALEMAGVGHTMRQVLPQWVLGVTALHAGRLDEAQKRFDEAMAVADRAQAARHRASALWGLAEVNAARGAEVESATRHLEALELRIGMADRLGMAQSLAALARVLGEDAATLGALADRTREEVGAVATPWEASLTAGLGKAEDGIEAVGMDEVRALVGQFVTERGKTWDG